MPQTSESILHAQFNALRRRWAISLLTTAVVVSVLAPIALGLPNLYRSTATLTVDQMPDPLNPAGSASQNLEVSGRLQTIRQEVLSRQSVLQLAQELDIYPALRQSGSLDTVVALMQRDVHVDPDRQPRGDGRVMTVSFKISYTGADPQKVAAVTNRLARYYSERSGTMRSGQATRTAAAIKVELESTRKELEDRDKRVMQFTQEHAGTLPAQIGTIQTKYSQATAALQSNTAEITRLIERRETTQTQIAVLLTPRPGADQSDPALRLVQAKRELNGLLQTLTPENYEVRKKMSEITSLEKQVAANVATNGSASGETSQLTLLQGQIADLNTRIADLQKKNEGVQAEMNKYDGIIMGAPVRSAEWDRLSSEAAQTRAMFNNLSTRYQEALVGERAQGGQSGRDFQILDPAVPADAPTAPDRFLLLIVTGLAAVVLGVGVGLVLDRLNRSFRSVDELRAFTHVPVLATIPKVVERKTRIRNLLLGTLAGAAVSVVLVFVSVGVFHYAQRAEPITRMLLR